MKTNLLSLIGLEKDDHYEPDTPLGHKSRSKYAFGGFRNRNVQAIFIPRSNRKLKGYMRAKTTFNKTK